MAGLTKQHFKAIAEIINGFNIRKFNIENDTNILILINQLSDYFKSQNPLFDENRFKKACLE